MIAEVNPKAVKTRFSQGWVDEVICDMDRLIERVNVARKENRVVSIAFQGNIVDVWEQFAGNNIKD